MNSKNTDPIYQLIVSHHKHLAGWLRDGDSRSFQAFLEAHDPNFSLVTTDGSIVSLATLRSGLSRGGGSRPGLSIEISDMTLLAPNVCRFLEEHHENGDVVDLRIVTAVVRDGLVVGLQETTRPVIDV